MADFPLLFSALKIGSFTIRNRIMTTPHHTAFTGPDGLPGAREIAYSVAKAKAGIRPVGSPRAGLLVLTSLVVLGGFGVACGGSDGSGSGGSQTGAKKTTAPKVTVPADAPQIDQENLTFKPDKVTAKVGETVYFLNSESAIHTVNVSGKNISGNMKKGTVVTWKGQTVGEYKITCDYHPQMKATVTLQ